MKRRLPVTFPEFSFLRKPDESVASPLCAEPVLALLNHPIGGLLEGAQMLGTMMAIHPFQRRRFSRGSAYGCTRACGHAMNGSQDPAIIEVMLTTRRLWIDRLSGGLGGRRKPKACPLLTANA